MSDLVVEMNEMQTAGMKFIDSSSLLLVRIATVVVYDGDLIHYFLLGKKFDSYAESVASTTGQQVKGSDGQMTI